MAKTLEVLPDPVSLIESMRAIGYTPETALADLIDNSISAGATSVNIEYDGTGEPFVAVLDDGHGMSAAGLTKAMRHGSSNPVDARSAQDLGRFGLGLKTASLSQCRRLTVVTKQENKVHVRCWDLDVVRAEKRWVVVVPDLRECRELPLYEELRGQERGTLVVWQQLDRLMSGSLDPATEMTARMANLHQHLSFVFHRYTRREAGSPPVAIAINGLPLKSIDPFLKGNSFTQPLEGQTISVNGQSIQVQPYVLPHMNYLTRDEAEYAGGREGLRSSQGFYVYRNRRLVISGTWFRLVPKEEFFKLTRVQVDIPNTLDHLWSLDIKKSAAYPPDIIRNRLRELIPHFAGTSRKTVTFPGRRQKQPPGFEPLWDRIEPSPGAFRYELNPDHSIIRSLTDTLDGSAQKALQHILDLVAAALPLESIYSDMCGDRRTKLEDRYAETATVAARIMEITGFTIKTVIALDPVARFPQYHEQLLKEFEQ
ncbi:MULTISPECIES: ATP-binding protein [unclassified Janthinobacterium]|uniref:ATP-binding protein n=1 Tax=unclassified Janthinobacterium TaxID=2610881 RepID=UPI00184FC84B|nr:MULTISPECIES: ATP-binding protein [unclassified Janthinobacterium]MBB5371639.1 hypothetical protein [Janthinobacterium sp. K2C7]MBB5384444.1 hypothetical protein [Janthinobacterium sp. K2Li3]MBB5389720.1 hypothetical protein [Janthinobacterium sp. K2E3]